MGIGNACVPRETLVLPMSWHRELSTGAVAARFFDEIVLRLQAAVAPPPPDSASCP